MHLASHHRRIIHRLHLLGTTQTHTAWQILPGAWAWVMGLNVETAWGRKWTVMWLPRRSRSSRHHVQQARQGEDHQEAPPEGHLQRLRHVRPVSDPGVQRGVQHDRPEQGWLHRQGGSARHAGLTGYVHRIHAWGSSSLLKNYQNISSRFIYLFIHLFWLEWKILHVSVGGAADCRPTSVVGLNAKLSSVLR